MSSKRWKPSCQFAAVALEYARDVRYGRTPACRYVKQACRRFERDLKRQGDDDFPYRLDEEETRRRCVFLELMPHQKGPWALRRERLDLSAWQVFCTVNAFGWVHVDTGLRRFRFVYIEVPRKNGKTFWIAGWGLSVLCQDPDIGTEVYCGATTEKQAWEVFRPAKQICEASSALRQKFGVEPFAKSIARQRANGRFEPIIGNPGDGASPSMAIADEFHEHSDSEQVDTMVTGMGAREQPMMVYITTAGADIGGPCYATRDDVLKVLAGTVEDETIFGVVYTLDEDDDWDTVEAQVKANPNLGISIKEDFLAGQLAQARRSATAQTAYKTKHLNLWVGAKQAWMNLLAFQRCRREGLKLENFRGERCFLGVDLASRVDVASMAMVFPPTPTRAQWAAFLRRWVPEARVLEEEGSRYQAWHAGGWLETTPGDVIDFDYIEEALGELKSQFQVMEVAYDPFQATQFSVHLMAEGFPMVEYGQTVKNFSEPMKELEASILRREFWFQDDPMLLWMMGNVVAKVDKKDNIFPDKERPMNKIDDVVALIMAFARARMPVEEGTRLSPDYSVPVA